MPHESPRDQVLVALDVETTGIDPSTDRIIEIGAVKFRGDNELATFSQLVNPRTKLSDFIVSLTGITQEDVDSAPEWGEIADVLREFIGDHTMVGHNVRFDAAFLRSHGIRVSGVYDTFDMARIALPGGPEYSLGKLAERYKFDHDAPHRALSDAMATRHIFLELLAILEGFEPAVLEQFARLGRSSSWPVASLARGILSDREGADLGPAPGIFGIDRDSLASRVRAGRANREGRPAGPLDPGVILQQVSATFAGGGALQSALPGYEPRPEQAEMARAVATAIASEQNLLVEAGTGVGKSLAYLVPAVLFSVSGGGPVVVSTNTINLQEQLLNKDIEVARRVLENVLGQDVQLNVAQLKGRSNYLCYRRWSHAMTLPDHNETEARVLSKCLVWLQETSTGDRSELALGWDTPQFARYSAQGAAGCPPQDGPCFLRKARNQALTADILIVNHSLLLSDVAMGGGLLPPHEALVVDEAHHLVDVATRHLGFAAQQPQLAADIESLRGDRGVIGDVTRAIQAASSAEALDSLPTLSAETLQNADRAREFASEFFDQVRHFAASASPAAAGGQELRLVQTTRELPAWSAVTTAWENLDISLARLLTNLGALNAHGQRHAEGKSDLQAALLDITAANDSLFTTKTGLSQAVYEPRDDYVYWLTVRQGAAGVTVQGAPLDVGPILKESLFDKERSVVLTGATMSFEGGFDRLKNSLGLDETEELILGSPFDYEDAALIAVPEDMPEPGSPGHAVESARAITEVVRGAGDRTLVLFTSHSALETARKAIAPVLAQDGFTVIGQGNDGSPQRIMDMLAANPRTVALGTSSLWEGVDLQGTPLNALVMARLPFPVPTEPIFAARSELFENGFGEYAIPEAVLRFRQGFGRLIRSKGDRGVFVVLDSRIITKRYGVMFQRALPKCTVRRTTIDRLQELAKDWSNGEPV